MSVCCGCCVLSGTGLCDSYRGVPPRVECLSVIVTPQKCVGPLGLLRHGERIYMTSRFEAKCARSEIKIM